MSIEAVKSTADKVEAAKKMIAKKDGQFYGTHERGGHTYVEFACSEGHLSSKICGRFATEWCGVCRLVTVGKCRDVAEKRGGRFISEEWVNSKTKYTWECAVGHRWQALYSAVRAGSWCPHCLKIPLDWFCKYAESKGGVCLSKTLQSTGDMLQFRCAEGHEWTTKGLIIRKGTWCPTCQLHLNERTCTRIMAHLYGREFPKKRPAWLRSTEGDCGQMELDGYCEELQVAFEYQGKQHYEFTPYWHKTIERFKAQQRRDELKVQLCAEHGVDLLIVPYTIPYADLAKHILANAPKLPEGHPQSVENEDLQLQGYGRDMLRKADSLVSAHPGAVLESTTYVDNISPLQVTCGVGHRFQITLGALTSGRFCPDCARAERMADKVKDMETTLGWRLLSPWTYAKASLVWECTKCKQTVRSNRSYMLKRKRCGCYET